MKLKLSLAALLILALTACGAFQTLPVTISGYVVDMKAGEPVVGVNVTIVQTGESATTNAQGHYSINTHRGRYTLVFTKEGFATSKVTGLLTLDENTLYSTILRPVFDPEATTEPPELTLDIPEWFMPGEEVTATVNGSVAEPDTNGFQFLDVAIGQPGGSSGYLNSYVRHQRFFDFDGSSKDITLDTTGYTDIATVHAIAYDINGNRTEAIGYIYRSPDAAAPEPVAPTDLRAQAVTFGDVAVFGTLSVPGLTGDAVIAAMKSYDLNALKELSQKIRTSAAKQGIIAPQDSSLDKAITWVDLNWSYDSNAPAPEAFEVFRKNGADGEFYSIGRIAAADAQDKDNNGDPIPGSYSFRDATPGTLPGELLTYQVEAINGDHRAASNEYEVTPLPAFQVEAVAPADNTTDVDLQPGYVISVHNSSTINFLMAIVLDRVQVDGFNVEYQSPLFVVNGTDGEFHPFAGLVGIPHGLVETAGGYALTNATLQPFHTYDWQPFAVTAHLNDDGEMDAVSIGSDFFGLWGPFAVEDGPVSTFVTGSGAAPVAAEGR